ncbi:uncharacterized protein EI97DRAFT_408199 [Westerdykella ornata]|uniref:MICOS complex subunit MIC60 n=1 Tax=Westerdykella ornata TaxID=318751 RepID=A0A6A6J8A4_WESOR|nr:uncharacterized protein EI97DRAFT_408199 [Westerdykella ornata]KAF2271439.1 hypothetical protein EI97DRAFT_408199 [Westerdykella ornata]
MLRASIARARPGLRPIAAAARPQWRVAQRFYADEKKPITDTVPPTTAPSAAPANPGEPGDVRILSSQTPKSPAPAAPETSASRSAPVEQPETTPPTGTGTASVAPGPIKPTPKPKKRRLVRALWWLTLLSVLGYGGGVYYSLVSDNFHDFFTEYIPFGEDAVGYFEEREFRKRFPGRAGSPRVQPQVPEKKVTIPGKSGLGARVAEEASGSTVAKGPHVSAVEDKDASKGQQPQKVGTSTPEQKEVDAEPVKTAAPPITPIDHLNVSSADEPIVQDVVQILNGIITMVNADPAHGNKYNSALEKAKSDLSKVVSDIKLLKDSLQKSAEEDIKAAHTRFDEAARELISRLEVQMHKQEAQWKEEFETERERLSQTYQEKLHSELDIAKQVYEQQLKNELLKQSIALQKDFTAKVRERVEAEREGRLGRLNELSSSVQELERLTAEWNSVVDANLKTQHLVVAVEAVKAALENQAHPKPFVTELAALKEIADDDPVVSAAIASINPAAYQRGIPNAGQLIDRFRRVAQEVRKAALLPEDAGVASHLASLAMSKVLFKKSGLAVGADVEAVLARTEVLLEEGDLDGAAREMNSLQGWAKVLSKDWLSDCRRVLEVRQALDVIAAEARLQTLLVD